MHQRLNPEKAPYPATGGVGHIVAVFEMVLALDGDYRIAETTGLHCGQVVFGTINLVHLVQLLGADGRIGFQPDIALGFQKVEHIVVVPLDCLPVLSGALALGELKVVRHQPLQSRKSPEKDALDLRFHLFSQVWIVHASIHGNTAYASEALKSKLEGKGAQVTMCDLTATDLSYAVTSAFYCGKLVLACATYDGGLFPPMKEFLEHLQTKGFRNRRIGLIENGSWAPAAARLMRTKLEEMKDIHLYETVVSLRGALNQTSEAQMDALVAELCAE